MTPHGGVRLPRPLLLLDRGCPFAHRVLAVLDHLGIAFDLREAPVGQRPEGLEAHSPSGRIPLLVHGDLVLGESTVIMTYLAEAYGFDGDLPQSFVGRAKHRHAMAVAENFVAPLLFREDAMETARLSESIDVLEHVVDGTDPAPSLLAFHLAPFWLRFQWWRQKGVVHRAILRRGRLASWLDEVARLPAVERTAESRADSITEFCAYRAEQAGQGPGG